MIRIVILAIFIILVAIIALVRTPEEVREKISNKMDEKIANAIESIFMLGEKIFKI